jgi:hypothetical protein
VSVNPSASVLLMTTGILREMAWVVFDEIHYMRDPARGLVWEESIALLECPCVSPSATIPDAREFAEWAALRGRACHEIATSRRVVPLRLYRAPCGPEPILVRTGDGGVSRGAWDAAFSPVRRGHDRAAFAEHTAAVSRSRVAELISGPAVLTKQHQPSSGTRTKRAGLSGISRFLASISRMRVWSPARGSRTSRCPRSQT